MAQRWFKPGRLAAEPELLTTTLHIPGAGLNVRQVLFTVQLRNLRLRAVEQQLKVTQLGSEREEIESRPGSRASVRRPPPPTPHLLQSCQVLGSPKQIYPTSLHCSVSFSKSVPPSGPQFPNPEDAWVLDQQIFEIPCSCERPCRVKCGASG